jgi:hypothetical protein
VTTETGEILKYEGEYKRDKRFGKVEELSYEAQDGE